MKQIDIFFPPFSKQDKRDPILDRIGNSSGVVTGQS